MRRPWTLETCQTARFDSSTDRREAGFQDRRPLKSREVRGGLSAWLQGFVQIVGRIGLPYLLGLFRAKKPLSLCHSRTTSFRKPESMSARQAIVTPFSCYFNIREIDLSIANLEPSIIKSDSSAPILKRRAISFCSLKLDFQSGITIKLLFLGLTALRTRRLTLIF